MKEWGGENRRKASCFLPADRMFIHVRIYGGFPGGSVGKESACSAGDPNSMPGSGRSPEEGNGNPLQYSCLENSMDGGAWRAIVHRVARVYDLAT